MTFSRKTQNSPCLSLRSLPMGRNTWLNKIFKTSTPPGMMTPIFNLLKRTRRSRLRLSFSFDILLTYFSVQASSSKGTTPKNPKPKSLKSRFKGTATTEEVADTATAKVQPRRLNKTQMGSVKDKPSMGAYLSSLLLEALPICSSS